MKKKDYELIANALRFAKDEDWSGTVRCMAYTLRHNDPKFQEDKFLQLCGIQKKLYNDNPYVDELL